VALRLVRRCLGPLVALLALALTARSLDLRASLDLIRALGPILLLLPLPFFSTLLLDSLVWRRLLGREVPFGRVLGVRVAAEAVVLSLPSGALLSDALSLSWLRRDCGLSLPQAAAALLVRKGFLALAHGLFVLVGALLLLRLPAPPSLPAAAAISGLLVGSAGLLLLLATWESRLATRLSAWLQGSPLPSLRRWATARAVAFRETDAWLSGALPGGVARLPPLLLPYLLCWVVDATESFLILLLLGAPLPFLQVLPGEALMSLVRLAAFFVPAGLGLQDAGWVLYLRWLGLPEAAGVGAAFLLLKRGREAFFMLLGVLLRAWAERGAAAEPECLPS